MPGTLEILCPCLLTPVFLLLPHNPWLHALTYIRYFPTGSPPEHHVYYHSHHVNPKWNSEEVP